MRAIVDAFLPASYGAQAQAGRAHGAMLRDADAQARRIAEYAASGRGAAATGAQQALAGAAFDYDLVVIGLGPGGGSAALSGAREGAKVLGLELRQPGMAAGQWGSRGRQAMLQSGTTDILDELGAARTILGDHIPGGPWETASASIGGIERGLVELAAGRGADLRFGAEVTRLAQRVDGGVDVTVLGATKAVRARTVIDATGGRNPLLRELGLALGPPESMRGSFAIGAYPYQPHLKQGVTQLRSSAGAKEFPEGVALNHPIHGAHVDFFDPPRGADADAVAAWHRDRARHHGITGEPATPAAVVHATKQRASRVRSLPPEGAPPGVRGGDVIVVGDGAARKDPAWGRGAQDAIADGRRGALAALAPDREAALRAFEQDTIRNHQRYLDDPTRSLLIPLPRVMMSASG